jgi:hypothetical protein
MLIHLGFSLPLLKWIMVCVCSTLFVVLINGSTSSLFKTPRGLRKGFPMSPYLFLLVIEGLSRLIKEAERQRKLSSIKVGRSESLTCLIFVDDVLIFYFDNDGEGQVFKDILQLYFVATCMDIIENNYALFTFCLDDTQNTRMEIIFPFQHLDINEGVKYIGFIIKLNNYGKSNWGWILSRIKNHISLWCNRWLYRGVMLVLVKSILEAIPIFSHSLVNIPTCIFERIEKCCFNFLWKGSSEYKGSHLSRWKLIATPKCQWGWGFKYIHLFGQSLATNSL